MVSTLLGVGFGSLGSSLGQGHCIIWSHCARLLDKTLLSQCCLHPGPGLVIVLISSVVKLLSAMITSTLQYTVFRQSIKKRGREGRREEGTKGERKKKRNGWRKEEVTLMNTCKDSYYSLQQHILFFITNVEKSVITSA